MQPELLSIVDEEEELGLHGKFLKKGLLVKKAKTAKEKTSAATKASSNN